MSLSYIACLSDSRLVCKHVYNVTSLEQYSINTLTCEQSLSVFSYLMISDGISGLECYSIFDHRW